MRLNKLHLTIPVIILIITYFALRPVKHYNYDNNNNLREFYEKNLLGYYFGEIEIYDSLGRKVRKFHLITDSILNGSDSSFYYNGEVNEVFNWKNNTQSGISKKFHENGILEYEYIWKEGVRIDSGFIYYNNGNLKEVQSFNKNGLLNGIIRKYNSNGKCISELKYLDGKLISKYKE